MKLARLALIATIFISPVLADVIDFENLPNTYMFVGDGQNIGTYYSGVDFEQNVTGLDLTGDTAYPPHSGSIAVWDPYDLSLTISFTTPQSMVGIWYTSFDVLTLAAFDPTATLLGSSVGAANTDGTIGTSDFLSFTGSDIASITLTGSPGGFVLDDLTFTSGTVADTPEPSSILSYFALAGIACWLRGGRRLRSNR